MIPPIARPRSVLMLAHKGGESAASYLMVQLVGVLVQLVDLLVQLVDVLVQLRSSFLTSLVQFQV